MFFFDSSLLFSLSFVSRCFFCCCFVVMYLRKKKQAISFGSTPSHLPLPPFHIPRLLLSHILTAKSPLLRSPLPLSSPSSLFVPCCHMIFLSMFACVFSSFRRSLSLSFSFALLSCDVCSVFLFFRSHNCRYFTLCLCQKPHF